MQLYPAIDLKDGACVRLRQGAFDDVTRYGDDPGAMAAHWGEQGATFLHVVDLDGARNGRPTNLDAIRSIRKAVSFPIEVGGGIRNEEACEQLFAEGVDRVIIGTRAVTDPEFLNRLLERFGPEKVIAGVDAKNGYVAVSGWEELSTVTSESLCLRMKEQGILHVIYTDISRDGMMSGPNVAATKHLTEATGLDIIASGGVSCMEDLTSLDKAGIRGAILGKALYEGAVDLREAVRLFQGK